MKKLFTKDKVRVYGYLSAFCLASTVAVIATMVALTFFSWPVDTMPISSLPRLLFFATMIFGVLTVMSRWKMNIFILATLAVMVTLSVTTFNSLSNSLSQTLVSSFYNPPSYSRDMTLAIKSKWDRNYNAGFGVVVVKSICIANGTLLIDIYNGTKIYEQDGTSRQKRQGGIEAVDALQPGQVVDITFTRFKDDEFYKLLNQKKIDLGVILWQGAAEITIHKGEYVPVSSRIGTDLCERLSSK